MVDVKVTILYIHGAGHVQGGWLYAVGRKNCDMTGGVLVRGAGTNPVQSVIGCFFWGLRLRQPCATCSQAVSARNRSLIKVSKLDNQSKFSKESFSRSKLCRLALAGVLPHEAGIILYICSPKCLKFGSSHRGKRRIFLFINSTLISCECKGIYPWIAGLKGFLTVCG